VDSEEEVGGEATIEDEMEATEEMEV